MKNLLLLSLLFFAFSASASRKKTQTEASTCPNFDLRNYALGMPLDQGSTGYCYAFAATDMLTHFFNQKVGAPAVVTSYVEDLSGFSRFFRQLAYKNETNGGYIKPALQKAVSDGVCLQKDVINKYKQYWQIEKLQSDLKAQTVNTTNICNQRQSSGKIITSNLRKAGSTTKYYDFLTFINTSFLMNRIIGVEYQTRFFSVEGSRTGGHASTIVAQKYDSQNKSCQILIRNTWGQDHSVYKYPFENGHVWVPRKKLYENYYDIIRIESCKNCEIELESSEYDTVNNWGDFSH